MDNCIFCQIASGKSKTKLIYEDKKVAAFGDISPKAPVHFLIVPKKHISTLLELKKENAELVGKMFLVAQKLAKEKGLDKSGFRTIFNTGAHSGQIVDHLHLHLLGGRKFGPMG